MTAIWSLSGEVLACFVRGGRILKLPASVRALPGPGLLLVERYTESPVGAFCALNYGEPARIGMRAGYFFGIVGVNSAHALRVVRSHWGLPAVLGSLTWERSADACRVEWPERGLCIEADVARLAMPFLLPARAMQSRHDGLVLVTSRVRSSLGRHCTYTLGVDDHQPLSRLAGTGHGMLISHAQVRRGPAKRVAGRFLPLRLAQPSAEPGIVGWES